MKSLFVILLPWGWRSSEGVKHWFLYIFRRVWMSDAWVGVVEHIRRGLIQKPDARMGEGDTIILRNPRLQVYVLIFV